MNFYLAAAAPDSCIGVVGRCFRNALCLHASGSLSVIPHSMLLRPGAFCATRTYSEVD